jgi:hypothetical protein
MRMHPGCRPHVGFAFGASYRFSQGVEPSHADADEAIDARPPGAREHLGARRFRAVVRVEVAM